jgi:hypothetical protein
MRTALPGSASAVVDGVVLRECQHAGRRQFDLDQIGLDDRVIAAVIAVRPVRIRVVMFLGSAGRGVEANDRSKDAQ